MGFAVVDLTIAGGGMSIKAAQAAYTSTTGVHVVMNASNTMCPPGTNGGIISVLVGPGAPPSARVAWCAGGGDASPIATSTDGKNDTIVWSYNGALKGYDGDTGAAVASPMGNCNGVRQWTSPIAVKGRIVVGADGKLCSWSVHQDGHADAFRLHRRRAPRARLLVIQGEIERLARSGRRCRRRRRERRRGRSGHDRDCGRSGHGRCCRAWRARPVLQARSGRDPAQRARRAATGAAGAAGTTRDRGRGRCCGRGGHDWCCGRGRGPRATRALEAPRAWASSWAPMAIPPESVLTRKRFGATRATASSSSRSSRRASPYGS